MNRKLTLAALSLSAGLLAGCASDMPQGASWDECVLPAPKTSFEDHVEQTVAALQDREGSAREALEEELERLPDGLVDAFAESGWSIEITDKDLDAEYFAGSLGHVNGATVPDEDKIYLAATPLDVRKALAHEFGHWLDLHLGKDSSSDGFGSAASEQDSLRDSCELRRIEDRQELYAEAFRVYVEDPDRLCEACPGLYAHFDAAVVRACAG